MDPTGWKGRTGLGPARPRSRPWQRQRGRDQQPHTPRCPHQAEGCGHPSQSGVSVPSPAQRLRTGRGTRSSGTGPSSSGSLSRKRPRPRNGLWGAAAAAGGGLWGRAAHVAAPPRPGIPWMLGRPVLRAAGAERSGAPHVGSSPVGRHGQSRSVTRPRGLSPRFPLSPTRGHPPTCRSRPPPSRRAPRGRAGAEYPGVRARGCDRPQRCEATRPGSAGRLRRFLCRLQRGAARFFFSLGAAAQRSAAPPCAGGTALRNGATAGKAQTGPAAPGTASAPLSAPGRAHILPPRCAPAVSGQCKPPCRCEVRTEKERRVYESGPRGLWAFEAFWASGFLGFGPLRSARSAPVRRRRHAGRAEG